MHPQPEGYHGNVNTVGPRSCYDEGKRFAESLLTDFCRTRSLRLRMVRIFNTYGPRMLANDGRVVSNFVVQALRGEPITIHGDARLLSVSASSVNRELSLISTVFTHAMKEWRLGFAVQQHQRFALAARAPFGNGPASRAE